MDRDLVVGARVRTRRGDGIDVRRPTAGARRRGGSVVRPVSSVECGGVRPGCIEQSGSAGARAWPGSASRWQERAPLRPTTGGGRGRRRAEPGDLSAAEAHDPVQSRKARQDPARGLHRLSCARQDQPLEPGLASARRDALRRMPSHGPQRPRRRARQTRRPDQPVRLLSRRLPRIGREPRRAAAHTATEPALRSRGPRGAQHRMCAVPRRGTEPGACDARPDAAYARLFQVPPGAATCTGQGARRLLDVSPERGAGSDEDALLDRCAQSARLAPQCRARTRLDRTSPNRRSQRQPAVRDLSHPALLHRLPRWTRAPTPHPPERLAEPSRGRGPAEQPALHQLPSRAIVLSGMSPACGGDGERTVRKLCRSWTLPSSQGDLDGPATRAWSSLVGSRTEPERLRQLPHRA